MMTAINGVMLAAGSSLVALIVVKVTIVAALGLAATWLARGSRAAVRHALLAVTFGATLVLPIASIIAPPVHVTVPVAEVSRAAWPLVVNTPAPIPPVTAAADGDRVAPAAPQQSSTFSLSVLLLAGWIVGIAVFLVPVMTGLWQIRSLRRSGLPWLEGQSIAETLALDAGIHRRVEVLLHEALQGPITCGVLGPAIVLPRDAESWAREDLSRAIVHELEHVRRGDSATRCLARAVCSLYWFHPLAWIAWRKLVLEAERSCDDAVLRRSEATAYADQLVGLAKRLPTAQRLPLLAMASRSDLSARVGAVLDSRQNRGRAGTFSVALACAAAAVLVTAISPLMLVAAPQASSEPRTKAARQVLEPGLKFEVASVRPAPDPISAIQSGQPPRVAGTRIDAATVEITSATMMTFIREAYGVEVYQVTGPDWLTSSRVKFDVRAKIPDGATREQVPEMLRSLLIERFKLAVHRVQKEQAVYALVVRKNGPRLRESSPEPLSSSDSKDRPANNGKPGNGKENLLRGTVNQLEDGGTVKVSMVDGVLHQEYSGITAQALANRLVGLVGRPVLDMTGLKGTYEVSLAISQEDILATIPGRSANGGALPSDGVGVASDPTGGRSIFAAIENLGLKLESRRAPVEELVIDHIEKVPTEN